MRIAGTWSEGQGAIKRREDRHVVPFLGIRSPAVEVRLVNVSASGLGIEVRRELRVGVIYPFRLRRGSLASEVYGLVRWCEPAGEGRFRAGVSVGKTIGPALSRLSS